MKTKVFVMDTNLNFLDSAVHYLEKLDGVEVTGSTSSPDDCYLKLQHDTPHVVLIDLAMIQQSGNQILASIERLDHPPTIIYTTMHRTDEISFGTFDNSEQRIISKIEFGKNLLTILQSTTRLRA